MTERTDLLLESCQNVKMVWMSYSKWLAGGALLAVLASIAVIYANAYLPLTAFIIKIIQILSLVVEVATLGQRGHTILTWGGESPAEKLDGRLFVILSSLGFFLIIFSFQLEIS